MRIVFWVALLTFVADQISKYFVVHWLNLAQRLAIDVYPPFLNLRMAWNYGVNFGLFAEDNHLTRWVLITVALVISLAVFWWVSRETPNTLGRISAGLLVGGALGNVIDRIIYGAVADFLNMSCCGFNNPFSFNIADIAVFVGAVGLVLFTSGETDQNPS
ncbi:signal peptidase II [uncultured Lentibacter sp.]|uniref:signal peptidase II n=1 Tax=uncultured Lentibacter sp. TaxID=1659309 RepID=UPI002613DD0B|nr:signal peptidase II [uncultured Lentibacter sp.]MCW1955046.1 signal peptidase II [Roseobacter sp.]